jgi:hypothetical protein
MATVSRQLPTRPHLDVPKREARELLAQWREGRPEALERIRHRHPKFNQVPEDSIAIPTFKLNEAQRVIASEYGFASWAALKKRISADTTIGELQDAIESGDRDTVGKILRANPELATSLERLAEKPYDDGWIYEFEGAPDSRAMDVNGYRNLLDATIDRMLQKEQESQASHE